MEKMRLKTKLGSFAAIAIFLVMPTTSAWAVVPPGNSAVNQYTETFPTAGGAETTKRSGKRDARPHRSPVETLGAKKVRKLAVEGPVGREVAAVVAATAPSAIQPDRNSDSETGARAAAREPEGSSGFREVISQATGSSDSGQMGLLLPLVILAAIAGSALYFWRQRRHAA
jgi:hypothetical protein